MLFGNRNVERNPDEEPESYVGLFLPLGPHLQGGWGPVRLLCSKKEEKINVLYCLFSWCVWNFESFHCRIIFLSVSSTNVPCLRSPVGGAVWLMILKYIYLLLNVLRWHWLVNLCRFKVYNSIIIYVLYCVFTIQNQQKREMGHTRLIKSR